MFLSLKKLKEILGNTETIIEDQAVSLEGET